MTGRIEVIPRGNACCFRFREEAACVIDINRLVSTWDAERKLWIPQMRLCHLHAEEAVTGRPVMKETHADRERIMLELSA